MSMVQIYKIEFLKVMKKPITAILLIPLLLPLFYAISIRTDASFLNWGGQMNAISFSYMMWMMLQILGLTHVLFALSATHYFAHELEGGQIKGMLVRGCCRSKLLISKVLVQMSLLIGTYIIFYLFSTVLFLILGLKELMTQFQYTPLMRSEILAMGLGDLIYLVGIAMIITLVLCLGLYKRSLSSFLIGVSFHYVLILSQFFPIAKYFSPDYVAYQLTSSEGIPLGVGALMLGAYVLLTLIPIIVAIKKFNQIDIS